MNDLENVSAMDIKISLAEMKEPSDRGLLYSLDEEWIPIKEVTALRLDNRPLPERIYPSLKN